MINTNLTPEERHIQSLSNNGARIKAPDSTTEPVSMDFYRRAAYCASLPYQRFDDTTNKRF